MLAYAAFLKINGNANRLVHIKHVVENWKDLIHYAWRLVYKLLRKKMCCVFSNRFVFNLTFRSAVHSLTVILHAGTFQ